MPILFLIVGVLLVIVAINDKLTELTGLVKDDFIPSQGNPGFAIWLLAIFALGAIGFYRPLKPFSNAFLVLLVVAMMLSNQGFVEKFTAAIEKA